MILQPTMLPTDSDQTVATYKGALTSFISSHLISSHLKGLVYRNANGRINSVDDPSTSHRNLVSLGPVT